MSEMSTVITPAKEQPAASQARHAVPWLTVVSLAVVMAYADGFWMTSLRGAVGSIERSQEPFTTWFQESTLALPIYVLAVLGALWLARRWLGPVLLRPRAVVAAALMVVAAGTLVGVAEVAASSAYDYRLQATRVQVMDSMRGTDAMPGMAMPGTCAGGDCTTQPRQASLALQVRAVSFGSGILLVTNLVLVGWVVAVRGGRLDASPIRRRASRPLPQPGS